LMDFLPWTTFARIVERYGGDRYVKSLRCAEHFRVMAFAQLTYRESLRDIEACLSAQCQRRRENASAGRSKNALRTDGRSAANARHWFKQRHRGISFAVRSMSLLSRPDLA